jgi:hypothetical protein
MAQMLSIIFWLLLIVPPDYLPILTQRLRKEAKGSLENAMNRLVIID